MYHYCVQPVQASFQELVGEWIAGKGSVAKKAPNTAVAVKLVKGISAASKPKTLHDSRPKDVAAAASTASGSSPAAAFVGAKPVKPQYKAIGKGP